MKHTEEKKVFEPVCMEIIAFEAEDVISKSPIVLPEDSWI